MTQGCRGWSPPAALLPSSRSVALCGAAPFLVRPPSASSSLWLLWPSCFHSFPSSCRRRRQDHSASKRARGMEPRDDHAVEVVIQPLPHIFHYIVLGYLVKIREHIVHHHRRLEVVVHVEDAANLHTNPRLYLHHPVSSGLRERE